jgi:ubiquinone biosynthesis monooxygenase Coq7
MRVRRFVYEIEAGEGVKDGHRHQYSGVIGCVAATRAAFAGRVSVSMMVGAAKDGERGTCSRMIKVNHAGEFGAVNIYRAQLMVARLAMPSLVSQLETFLAHENRHLNTFAEVLHARGIPRCKSYWFCGIAGFALGWVTSLFGRAGIMACTAAVEAVVTGHLVEQLVFLESQGDLEAVAAVQSIVSEEEEHKALGIAQGQDSLLFRPLGAVVTVATSCVIWLGMKL